MQIIAKVLQFLNFVGVRPILLLYFIVRKVYLLFFNENLVNPIDWQKDPLDGVWKKIKRLAIVFLCWSIAALLVDLFTRDDNFDMTPMLWVYIVEQYPHLIAEALVDFIQRFLILRPVAGIEILFDRCKLFLSDKNENSNNQTFAYWFFARALKDPGISHLYNKLWLNRNSLSKKQRKFQDAIAQQILDLCIEEFHRPLPENVSRVDSRRSSNNKKLLDVLIKRKVFGAKNKWITMNSLRRRFHSDDEESVDEHFRGLLDDEPDYDYGQLSSEQQQLLLSWFKIPIQSRESCEDEYDAESETEPEAETINQPKRKKVKRPMPEFKSQTDYSLCGLIGLIKDFWNRLNGPKTQNHNLINKTRKPSLAEAVIKPKPRTRSKSDDATSPKRQNIVNKATEEALSSTKLPVPYTAPFEVINLISNTDDLSATSDNKNVGDVLPKLEFKSKIPIRKPEMVRNRIVTRKSPGELQVISPSEGMKPPVTAAVHTSKSVLGDLTHKPFKAKPAPASTYKLPSDMINKDRPDRRAMKQHLSQPKVVTKPAEKAEPKQFHAKPAPSSTYKPMLYPFVVNSRSKVVEPVNGVV